MVVAHGDAGSFGASASPPPLDDYYEVTVHYYEIDGDDPPGRGFFVPAAGLLRIRPPTSPGPSIWLPTTPQVAAALDRVTRGLDPFPSPELTRVFVGTEEAADPKAYARLYGRFPRAPEVDASAPRRAIVLRSGRPSPWTDGSANLDYVPGGGVLVREGEVVRPPSDVLTLLEDPTAEPFEPSFSDMAAVAVLALILAIVLARRRPRLRIGRRRLRSGEAPSHGR